MTEMIELSINYIAMQGDGVGKHNGKPVFVPRVCVGETVQVQIREEKADAIYADLLEILLPSPQRQVASCLHYDVCGGCQLLHLTPETYVGFKHDIAQKLAIRLKSEAALQSVFTAGEGTRRRVDLTVQVKKGEVLFGFLAARSHQVADITSCMVLDSRLDALLSPLRAALSSFSKPSFAESIQFTLCEEGIDAAIQTKEKLKSGDKEKLIIFAEANGLLRLTENGQLIWRRTGRLPQVVMGNVAVELPAGAFLQATVTSQQAMADLVVRHMQGYEKIADLYGGCGTFSFPLVQAGHSVQLYEGAEEMVLAAHNAARTAGASEKFQSHARDLFKNPLSSDALQRFDAAVINPPRAGALPQTRQLAQSHLERIVMVSCNPATFERDAAILLQNGYKLTHLYPVDQFHGSYHLELVGIFSLSKC